MKYGGFFLLIGGSGDFPCPGGPPAIRCRFSADNGLTWSADTLLFLYESDLSGQTENKRDMKDAWAEMGRFFVGLPTTAVLTGGDILAVFCAGPETDRTSVEWVRIREE